MLYADERDRETERESVCVTAYLDEEGAHREEDRMGGWRSRHQGARNAVAVAVAENDPPLDSIPAHSLQQADVL